MDSSDEEEGLQSFEKALQEKPKAAKNGCEKAQQAWQSSSVHTLPQVNITA